MPMFTGQTIFLTWDHLNPEDKPKAKQLAKKIQAAGGTLTGCSQDADVLVSERCDVCGELGARQPLEGRA